MNDPSKPSYCADWPRLSEEAKEKACYQCQICGFQGKKNGTAKTMVQAAHVDHDSRNPEARIVVMCPWCHMFWDRKLHAENVHRTARRRERLGLGRKKKHTR